MVAYSFKRRFVEPIWAGTKNFTIRADRKRHARPGEELQLYYAMRTKQCRLITRAPCTAIIPITITRGRKPGVELGGLRVRARELDVFAQSDGFEGFADMLAFWEAEHPTVTVFSGVQIRWSAVRATYRIPSLDWMGPK